MSDCGPLNDIPEHITIGPASIPAKTQRQAMDWALVLASQGIEPVIQPTPEGRWELTIPSTDEARALAVIRQYRIENRHWHWRRTVLKQRVMFDWAASAWVVVMVMFHWLRSVNPAVTERGVMDGAAVRAGEWWRLVTATFLHGDIPHLAGNCVFGFILLALAMGRNGTGAGLLAATLAGVAGNVFSMAVHGPTHTSLGASGVVMAALGMLTVPTRRWFAETAARRRTVFGALAGAVLLFTLLGLSPNSDVAAHAGGFVAGIFCGWLLSNWPELADNAPLNVAAGLLFGILAGMSWALAVT
jgi:membrane associated rhomboid family serine protease